MTKKVYICGDSFCVPDPEYGACWVDHLSEHIEVINLAKVAATNLMISMQVDYAIKMKPDFIIMQGTACTRNQFKHNGSIVPYSYHTMNTIIDVLGKRKIDLLKEYYVEFFDIEIAVYENQCIVENTLHKLVGSGIPFLFDQGGFEHHSYGTTKKYFQKFNQYRSKINLWDYSITRKYRPYYHIVDPKVHRAVADYYIKEIQ
jgi:hypothetical protein